VQRAELGKQHSLHPSKIIEQLRTLLGLETSMRTVEKQEQKRKKKTEQG
jgi:hypothetical protein